MTYKIASAYFKKEVDENGIHANYFKGILTRSKCFAYIHQPVK